MNIEKNTQEDSIQKMCLLEEKICTFEKSIDEELRKISSQTVAAPTKPEKPDHRISKLFFLVSTISLIVIYLLGLVSNSGVFDEITYHNIRTLSMLSEIGGIFVVGFYVCLFLGIYIRWKENKQFNDILVLYQREEREYRIHQANGARENNAILNSQISQCLEYQRRCLEWIEDIERELRELEAFSTMFKKLDINDVQDVIELQKKKLQHAQTVMDQNKSLEDKLRNRVSENQRKIDICRG